VEPAKKFDVFHQRHLRKSAYVEEGSSPAENAMIAASHSQQDPCVMTKAVRQSINQTSRQANSEVTANHIRITHHAPNLIQTSPGNFGIDMDKPKDFPAGSACAGIHLHGATSLAFNELIAKFGSEPSRAIGASAVCDNDLRFRRPLAKVPKKRPYQRCFVKNWDNDRDSRSNAFLGISCQTAIIWSPFCQDYTGLYRYGSAIDHRLIFALERLW